MRMHTDQRARYAEIIAFHLSGIAALHSGTFWTTMDCATPSIRLCWLRNIWWSALTIEPGNECPDKATAVHNCSKPETTHFYRATLCYWW